LLYCDTEKELYELVRSDNEANQVDLEEISHEEPQKKTKRTKNTTLAETQPSEADEFQASFNKLNAQAIETMLRHNEPETALDLLKQALIEFNAHQEKKVGRSRS
jgi:hypothetical protein